MNICPSVQVCKNEHVRRGSLGRISARGGPALNCKHMPGSGTAEIIFIAAMMVLILVISFGAVFFFMKTYRKEMAEREERRATKEAETATAGSKGANGNGES